MTRKSVIKFLRSAAFLSPVTPDSSAATVIGAGGRERRWGKSRDELGLLSVSTFVMADQASVLTRA
jgi:FAD/FMN-containing dehydrogenase